MTAATATEDHHAHAHGHLDHDSIDVFGFWIYIMTDCLLFATLFATYAVLQGATFGGPRLSELVSLPYVFGETMFLLASSFTYGLAMLSFYKKNRHWTFIWLAITFIFGASFVFMEVREFVHLYLEGHGFQSNAAMSAFYTLVGTHGTHVTIGLIWMALMMFQLLFYGTTAAMNRRLTYLGLFWHFLDIVWIFVFTIVYLMGAV